VVGWEHHDASNWTYATFLKVILTIARFRMFEAAIDQIIVTKLKK